MKMTKRTVNVVVFTAVALMIMLVFGYTFRMFHEINAMDLSGLTADSMGIKATNMVEDESAAEAGEVEAVRNVEQVIGKCMKDENVISSVRADYANHRMVYLMLADGAAKAAEEGNAEEWSKVKALGETASVEGEEILESNGLSGWDFDVEILNDSDPYRALLTFSDGECTYDCLA